MIIYKLCLYITIIGTFERVKEKIIGRRQCTCGGHATIQQGGDKIEFLGKIRIESLNILSQGLTKIFN